MRGFRSPNGTQATTWRCRTGSRSSRARWRRTPDRTASAFAGRYGGWCCTRSRTISASARSGCGSWGIEPPDPPAAKLEGEGVWYDRVYYRAARGVSGTIEGDGGPPGRFPRRAGARERRGTAGRARAGVPARRLLRPGEERRALPPAGLMRYLELRELLQLHQLLLDQSGASAGIR